MENEYVLQQFRRICREILKWKNFQIGGLGPLPGPIWVQGEGLIGEAGGEAPGR